MKTTHPHHKRIRAINNMKIFGIYSALLLAGLTGFKYFLQSQSSVAGAADPASSVGALADSLFVLFVPFAVLAFGALIWFIADIRNILLRQASMAKPESRFAPVRGEQDPAHLVRQIREIGEERRMSALR